MLNVYTSQNDILDMIIDFVDKTLNSTLITKKNLLPFAFCLLSFIIFAYY